MKQMDFRNPDKTCRPAPFWSWNGTMMPDEVKRQAKMMYEQGFGGYFMHSRVGLESPYMGEEWMTAIGAGIDIAKDLDMEAWFYDEDKWPSGFAGGMVPALGDDYRVKGLEMKVMNAGYLAQAWRAPGSGLQANALRVVYSVEMKDGRLVQFGRLPGVPDAKADGLYILCQMRTALSGQDRFNGESYVDLMDAKVTEAFIQCTHEAYKKRFGHTFGPNVPGIFTDEPNISPLSGAVATPWTPGLPAKFQELWGYDITDRLPLLFLDGEGSKQVRHDYWATVTILFRDNFSKPFGEWCERNGVIMTGHYLREDNPVEQALTLGAVMPQYPYQQLPGIDHLGRNIRDPQTLKQVSSVAHQMGRKRVLCEIFGVAGHSMSFADQKWMSDFHFALGITFLNQHLTLYSMLGERKRDYPANISWAQPYWQDYRTFNDYAARCSWFTQRGDFRSDILLLHPMSTIWSLLPGKSDDPTFKARVADAYGFKDQFLAVFNTLLTEHRDFDLGDELVMADFAAVEGAQLRVGDIRYKAVVLPYCTVLEPSTAKLLASFLQAGGQVYLVGDQSLAGSLAGVRFVADAQALVADLDANLARLVSVKDSEGKQAAQVLYHQRVDGDRQLYFLANTNLHEGATLQVQVVAKGDVTVFDPTTGEVAVVGKGESTPFAWAAAQVLETSENGVVLQWQVPPAGSLMFSVGAGLDSVASADKADGVPGGQWYANFPGSLAAEKTTINGPWQFSRLHPNVLTLDYCRAAIAGKPMSAEFRPTPAVREDVLKACGRTTQIQPYQYLTGQVKSQPVPVQLEFRFNTEELPAKLALALEKPDNVTVAVNGKPATVKAVNEAGVDLAIEWLSDPGYGALDIKSLAQKGENTVTLSFIAAADEADVEEIYLLGDFGVWRREAGFTLGKEPETLAPGSWVEQGYPFYCGTMRYRLEIDGACRWVDLSDAAASLLRVSVNGGQAKLLPWHPWVVDVSQSLQAGKNSVEVDVVSSLRNGFGPLHHNQGDALPWVGPGEFKVNPKTWTDEYQFAPYGLLEPVRLG